MRLRPSAIPVHLSKAQSYQHASVWLGAVLVGLFAVLYARTVSLAQEWFFQRFSAIPYVISAGTPFAFLLATFLVRRFAPEAKGSGIPQVLQAIHEAKNPVQVEASWNSPLVSLRTAAVKVLSSLVGVLGGASIGREGPTVQIAASVFAAVGRRVRKFAPHIEMPSYLTAGAAAGVAAAFNTPLAGISFAIEEVIDTAFGSFRQAMMVAVILSGIVAQALLGNYLYFGRPNIMTPTFQVTYQAALIGLVGGAAGGIFARLLAYPAMTRLPRQWAVRAFLCGLLCAAIGLATHGATSGSGYETTERMLMAPSLASPDTGSAFFPLLKLITTALSYLSGMAGGIFSPSLSIGSGIGVSIAKVCGFVNFRICALMGMVAFFSGVIQAPLTAVIIVTEMTDRHILILPFMIAAFLGQGVGRLIMPRPLYHFLAQRHQEG